MNKIVFFILTFITAIFANAQLKIDGIALVVGNEIVTESDLDRELVIAQTQGLPLNDKCDLLNNVLIEKIIVNEAKQDTLISISSEQIKLRVNNQIENYRKRTSDEELLSAFGVNSILELKKELEIVLEDQMYGQRKQQFVTSNVGITPQEVRKFYEENKNALPKVSEEIELSHIIFKPIITKENKQIIIDKLIEIKKDIASGGGSFATKALIYSDDPGSSAKGGLYEKIKRGKFVTEFEEVAFTMQEGEISDPFETEFGFHIVKLEKRRGEEIDVRHILISPKPTVEEMFETRRLADSVVSKINEGQMTFSDAAREFSEDKFSKFNGGVISNSKNGGIKLKRDELNIKVDIALTGLNENEISTAFEDEYKTKKIVRIVKLNKITPEHEMNYNVDYEKLKGYSLNQKKQESLVEWAQEKAPFIFLKLDEKYQSCNFDINWIK